MKLWAKLRFHSPSRLLVKLRPALNALAESSLPEKTKKFRNGNQKTDREILQAAIFTHGISETLGIPTLEFAMSENQDCDCVSRYIEDGTEHYTPIQLKEFVPEKLRPRISLDEELGKLAKYTNSSDLIVAYYFNRTAKFPLIKIPRLQIGELWFYGCSTPDFSKWCLIGDCMKTPAEREFSLPAGFSYHP